MSNKLSNKEIERKFLINNIPFDINQLPNDDIFQGYINYSEDGTEVRLRKKGNKFFITVKSGGDIVRNETEVELSEDQFTHLWPLTRGKRVEKKRYYFPFNKKKIEVDVYKGKLAGLVTAEIEFDTKSEALDFNFPDWFGKELTSDVRYKNINLAKNGIPID